MNIKTPSFWYRPNGSPPPLLEKVLTPFSALYAAGYKMHQKTKQARKAFLPVICIGNIVAGGTGKTPTALALLNTLRKYGIAKNPFFLIRGYGGGEVGPLLVDPSIHTAWDTGDEALVLSRAASTIVSINRIEGADLALRKGADLVLMDDGLQNPGIHKDIKIVVVNGEMGFGNEKILPAGPLREPLQTGLAKADSFILIGQDHRDCIKNIPAGKPVFHAAIKAIQSKIPPKDKSYVAFAGLGYPDKFFSFLRNDVGLNIVKTVRFADHQPYNEENLKNLHQTALSLNAELLTTEKDMMRLPEIPGITVHTLPVELAWEDEELLAQFLKAKLVARET